MKVALINNFPSYSGTGRVPYSLFKSFRTGYQSEVTSDLYCTHYLKESDLLLPENKDVKFLQHFPYKKNETLSRLLLYFAGPLRIPRRYDLYHIGNHMLGNYLYFLKPAVITVHDLLQFKYTQEMGSSLTSRIYNSLLQFSLKALPKAERIICVSNWTREAVLKRFKLPDNRVVTVYNGVDHSVFKPGDRREARRKLGLPEDKKILLHVGAETERKNIPQLLKVTAALLKDGLEVQLIRIGEKTTESAGLINSLGLENNVVYFEDVPEKLMPSYYQAADTLLLPSLDEGFGFPVIEALSCGLPVVCSNVGPLPEIGGSAAAYAGPSDLNAWVGEIKQLLSLNGGSLQQIINRGVTHSNAFSWNRTAEETLKVYKNVLDN